MSLTAAAIVMGVAVAANPAGVDQKVVERFEAHEYRLTEGVEEPFTLPYRLLKPDDLEPGRKYPLVLFLHGAGERGEDNIAQLKYLPAWMSEPAMRRQYPCFLLAPQCPEERRWGTLDWRRDIRHYADEPAVEMQAVLGMLEQAINEYPIDTDRIYLTGLSMGGYGSWELATRHPDLFAAVAPICGAGDTANVKPLAGLPVWAWHGAEDQAVPVERSRQMIEAIREAGGDPKYTELPGVGHDSWTPAYTRKDGVLPWLFEQRK